MKTLFNRSSLKKQNLQADREYNQVLTDKRVNFFPSARNSGGANYCFL